METPILVTPEYNHASAAIKNAIDWIGTEWAASLW
jgi:NAD(P)H-dependent FMN reductase